MQFKESLHYEALEVDERNLVLTRSDVLLRHGVVGITGLPSHVYPKCAFHVREIEHQCLAPIVEVPAARLDPRSFRSIGVVLSRAGVGREKMNVSPRCYLQERRLRRPELRATRCQYEAATQ